MTEPLQVRHFEAWRFYVDSSMRGEDPYLVDLEEYDANGKCNCPHFTIRLEPDLVRGINRGFAQCKHIRAAWASALNGRKLRDACLVSLLRTGRFELSVEASQPFKIPEVKAPKITP